jgi:hypothetical protein
MHRRLAVVEFILYACGKMVFVSCLPPICPVLALKPRNVGTGEEGMEYMSVTEAADALGLLPGTLRSWIRLSWLAVERVEGRVWVPESEVARLFEEGSKGRCSLQTGGGQ